VLSLLRFSEHGSIRGVVAGYDDLGGGVKAGQLRVELLLILPVVESVFSLGEVASNQLRFCAAG
jgi:hypothetical protein